jgi:hypothetical protein
LSGDIVDFVPREEYEKWRDTELKPYSRIEPTEPHIFSFVKKFDIAFEEFERAAKKSYLLRIEMGTNTADEDREIANPYLLYTFNLERINDYYSLDPARHASAVQWLEEWLKTNEPYESYSAFKAANRE